MYICCFVRQCPKHLSTQALAPTQTAVGLPVALTTRIVWTLGSPIPKARIWSNPWRVTIHVDVTGIRWKKIFLPATVYGIKTWFVVDTGASITLLSRYHAGYMNKFLCLRDLTYGLSPNSVRWRLLMIHFWTLTLWYLWILGPVDKTLNGMYTYQQPKRMGIRLTEYPGLQAVSIPWTVPE